MDRALASGAKDAGSIPARGTENGFLVSWLASFLAVTLDRKK